MIKVILLNGNCKNIMTKVRQQEIFVASRLSIQ